MDLAWTTGVPCEVSNLRILISELCRCLKRSSARAVAQSVPGLAQRSRHHIHLQTQSQASWKGSLIKEIMSILSRAAWAALVPSPKLPRYFRYWQHGDVPSQTTWGLLIKKKTGMFRSHPACFGCLKSVPLRLLPLSPATVWPWPSLCSVGFTSRESHSISSTSNSNLHHSGFRSPPSPTIHHPACEVPLNLGRRKHCDLHPTNDRKPRLPARNGAQVKVYGPPVLSGWKLWNQWHIHRIIAGC